MSSKNLKNLAGLIVRDLGRQHHVLCRTTYADFMAMTGISRDYIRDTGNAEEIAALDAHPPHTLIMCQQPAATSGPRTYALYPPERIRYANAQDKKTKQAQAREAQAQRDAQSQQRREELRARAFDDLIERIARALYAHDRLNEPWEDVADLYRERGRVAATVAQQRP